MLKKRKYDILYPPITIFGDDYMEITDYKKQHVTIMVIQAVLITLGIGNVIYQFFINLPNIATGTAAIQSPYITTLFAYLAMIVYAFWGYKHSIVPFRLSVTAYEISLGIVLSRLIETGLKNVQPYVTLQTAVLLALALIFDNTFKKHKKAALISGGCIIALEISRSVVIFAMLIGSGASIAEIASAQPLDNFLLVSALYITYASRCHWSTFGKLNMFD